MTEQEMSNIETFEEFCNNNRCSTCRFKKFANIDGYFDCEKHFMKERDSELLDKVAEKIREHSGLHYVDCDGYFGGTAELIFKVDYWLDDIIAELKAEVSK